MEQQFLYKFRDWFFCLLIDFLVNSDWVVTIQDFKKSETIKARTYLGLTDYNGQIIYLDKDRGTPRIFIHELCHLVLGTVLERASKNLSWKELKKVRGKYRADKEFEWRELRTVEFEKLFYNSLNKRQIRILQDFIDEARERFRESEG